MPWTLETRIEIAPAGYVPTRKGILIVAPLIEARDAILTGLQPRRLTDEEIEELNRMEAQSRCETCSGHGVIPIAAAGNMELETTCPECGPDYR